MSNEAVVVVLLLTIGGGTGALLRYLVSQLIVARRVKRGLSRRGGFPVGTFIVNLAASFIAGLIIGLESQQILGIRWHAVLVIGLCGGLSTMSSFAFEMLQFITKHKTSDALGYLLLSVGGGLGLLVLGWLLGTM